jgi:hypothetical protein
VVGNWRQCRWTILVWLLTAGVGYPCTRTTVVSAREMLDNADVIVRARADGASPLGGMSLNAVRFIVLEILKGDEQLTTLALPGRLVERDDFNDHEPPYRIVRPGGREGSCYAQEYRQGVEYLLLLKKVKGGFGWTTRWYPLGPVNEQLRGDDDPWLVWVLDRVK